MDLTPKGICPELDASRERFRAWKERYEAEQRALINYAIAQARSNGHIGRTYKAVLVESMTYGDSKWKEQVET